MKIDRTAWADAYRLHDEALHKLDAMPQDVFWGWMAARMIEISNTHENSPLIMGLMIAIFEAIEAEDKARKDDIPNVI